MENQEKVNVEVQENKKGFWSKVWTVTKYVAPAVVVGVGTFAACKSAWKDGYDAQRAYEERKAARMNENATK